MNKELIKLANTLDEAGFKKEADAVDAIIKNANPLALPLVLPLVLEALAATAITVTLAVIIAYAAAKAYDMLRERDGDISEKDIEEAVKKALGSEGYRDRIQEHDGEIPEGWSPEGKPPKNIVEIIIGIVITALGTFAGKKVITDKRLETEMELERKQKLDDGESNSKFNIYIASYLNKNKKRVYYVGIDTDPGYHAQHGNTTTSSSLIQDAGGYKTKEFDFTMSFPFNVGNYTSSEELVKKSLSYINVDFLDALSTPWRSDGNYGKRRIVKFTGSSQNYDDIDQISVAGIACELVRNHSRSMRENRAGNIAYGSIRELFGQTVIAKNVLAGYSDELWEMEDKIRRQVLIDKIPQEKIVGTGFKVINIAQIRYGGEPLRRAEPEIREYRCSEVILPSSFETLQDE